MIIRICTLFLTLAVFPKSSELMFRNCCGKQRILEIYTRRYQMNPDAIQFFQISPGQHKVVVDEAGKFVIGYAKKHGSTYFLCPFVEEGPLHLGPNRIKIRIRDTRATTYITVLPNDSLNDLFFKPINPEYLRVVKAIPNPYDKVAAATAARNNVNL